MWSWVSNSGLMHARKVLCLRDTCLTWIFCYSGLYHNSPTPGQLIRLAFSQTLPPVPIQPPVTHLSCHNMLTILALHLWLRKSRTFIISMTISRVELGDHSSSFYIPSISKSIDLFLCYCLIDLHWWTTKAVIHLKQGARYFHLYYFVTYVFPIWIRRQC